MGAYPQSASVHCPYTVVRLVSSGQFYNSVTFQFDAMTDDGKDGSAAAETEAEEEDNNFDSASFSCPSEQQLTVDNY